MLLQFNFMLITLLVGSLLQADIAEGKMMFNEAKCVDCHASAHFKHRENKVNSYKKLSSSVNACAISSGVDWFDEDTDSVTRYLNEKHYHYKAPPKEEE